MIIQEKKIYLCSCVSTIRWGSGKPRPFTDKKFDNNRWLREFKTFIWNLYDMDVSLRKIYRHPGFHDGDPHHYAAEHAAEHEDEHDVFAALGAVERPLNDASLGNNLNSHNVDVKYSKLNF